MKQQLLEMRARLSTPEAWCQGYGALDADDHPCSPVDPVAVKWCLIGAVAATGGRPGAGDPVCDLMQQVVEKQTGHEYVSNFNDHETTTHKDVLAFLDLCLEECG